MELTITPAKKTFDGVDGEPNFELQIDSLTLDFGTVTYLMGHNGSGKSVYLKLLTGELNSDREPILLSFDASRDMASSKSAAIVRQRADDSLRQVRERCGDDVSEPHHRRVHPGAGARHRHPRAADRLNHRALDTRRPARPCGAALVISRPGSARPRLEVPQLSYARIHPLV